MKVLMIEDNDNVCKMMDMFFENQGMEATYVHDGKKGLETFKNGEWDFVILDIMLPSMNGIQICQEIRKVSQVPIIMLTAKDSESDQILGLEIGADDYVTKPFSPIALMARIKANYRRFRNMQVEEGNDSILQTKHFKIDKNTRVVTVKNDTIDNLTPKEFDLLLLLASNPKQVFSREQLLNKIWGYDFFGDERTVDAHIKKLRQKIEKDQTYVHTVWGVGYKFEESDG